MAFARASRVLTRLHARARARLVERVPRKMRLRGEEEEEEEDDDDDPKSW